MSLGVRALDALVPCGRGQRLGIFAGSGVGKSSLLGMIARSTSAEINVICLVGERGREVVEFMQRDLGPEGLARSVVVVRHVRPARAGAPEGRVHGDRDRGVLPRPGPRRAADDGLGHALRDGPARGRPGDRRAARHARLHAVACSRCSRSCSSARAPSPRGSITAPLHRARRRRRHERADRRRRPRHPRRPHRALPPPRARGPLPRGRRARVASRVWSARSSRPRPRRRQRGPQADGDLQGQGRPDLDRRLPAGHRPARSTRPSRPAARSTASSPGRHRALHGRGGRRDLAQLATLGGSFEPPVVDGDVARWRPEQGGMPLHNAIPPLHIPS